MGILKYGLEDVPLGIDTAGTIRRVGSNVRNITVGDRIFALAPHGCITDRLVLPSSLAVKLPNDLDFEDAASMPCCFATAIYSLLDVGGMGKGQVCACPLSLRLSPVLGIMHLETRGWSMFY